MASNFSALWREICGRFDKLAGAQEDINPFAPAAVAPGVLPVGELAMDSALESAGVLKSASETYGKTAEMVGKTRFIGYAALSLLQQNGIVQAMVDTIADEMMRKWIELEGERAQDVQGALDKYEVRKHFRWAADTTIYQGGCLLFLDMGDDSPEELEKELHLDSAKIPVGSFKGFRQVEPYTATPAYYNAWNPLADDYFKPTHWYIQGQKIHRSRFLYFSWNTAPVLLRPAYNFFGIPLPQVALPYVLNFERSRDAASELVYNFSLLGFKTNLTEMMQPGGENGTLVSGVKALVDRCKAFLGLRKNNGLAILDKDEDFFQVNTPLSGVEGLVAQQLELISLISRIPVTKLFGTPPRGFNATGESDERFFNDQINSIVARLFVDNFKRAKGVIELSSFGELQPQVVEKWQELLDPSPLEAAQIEQAEAAIDQVYLTNGVVLAEEVRAKINTTPGSSYQGKLAAGVQLPRVDLAGAELPNTIGATNGPDVTGVAKQLAARLQQLGVAGGI